MTIGSDREDARLFGLPHYYGANACPKPGHGNVKRTSNKQCHQCGLEYERQKRATADEDKRERERIRKREAKRAGLWVREDPAKKAARERAARAKAAAMPEAILARQQRELQQISDRLQRAMEAAKRRAEREAHAIAMAPIYAQRRIIHNRLKASARRALKRGFDGERVATAADAQAILIAQNYRCAYCGNDGEMHLDHIQPVSRGVRHVVENLQWLCASHNMAKHAAEDADFRQRIGVPLVTPWDGYVGRLLWLGLAAAA